VQVDPAEFRNGQKTRRDDLSVGDNHDDVGRKSLQDVLNFGSADFFWLMDGDASSERYFLYWRKGNFLPPAARTVGLSDDCNNLKIRLREEVLECGNGEQRRATENSSHAKPQQSLRRESNRLQSLPLALFFELFDFALDKVALEHAEVLQEQNPIQMVDFMTESARQKILAANLK
jgi:hypothetical protein